MQVKESYWISLVESADLTSMRVHKKDDWLHIAFWKFRFPLESHASGQWRSLLNQAGTDSLSGTAQFGIHGCVTAQSQSLMNKFRRKGTACFQRARDGLEKSSPTRVPRRTANGTTIKLHRSWIPPRWAVGRFGRICSRLSQPPPRSLSVCRNQQSETTQSSLRLPRVSPSPGGEGRGEISPKRFAL